MVGSFFGQVSKGWKLRAGLALGALAAATQLAFAADFYVALDGNDTWTGTKPGPAAGGGDGPFRAIHRAAAAVREMRKVQPDRTTPIVVQIRGGTHFLDRPLVLGPEDSGAADSPVVYEAFPGEEPVLSGGRPITGWKESTPGRWEVAIPEAPEGGWSFAQLYVNDHRRLRPVWPKNGYFFIAGELYPTKPGNPDRFTYPADSLEADWRNPSDIEVTTFHKWTMDRLRIASVDPEPRIVTFAGPTHSADQAPLNRSTWFRAENVFEKLGEPGEWYLDRPTGVLTYLARPGEEPAAANVVAPRLSQVVRLEGEPANGRSVAHVIFRGLTFAHTGWTTPERGYGFGQADVAVDGAISARYARDCALERCVVRHTGNWAVDWGDGCHGNRVEGCELFDLGAGGVKIGPTRVGWEPDTNKWASGCVVRDCLIAHGGRVLPAAVGVWLGHASSNVVANNHIVDFYYSGISVGWNWNPGFSPAHHNTIVSNHIHDIGQGVLSDMGGIYTLGESPGTTLMFNRIHDVNRARYGGFGIYFDQGSAHILAESNSIYRTQDSEVHRNCGTGNTIRNNICDIGSNGQVRTSGEGGTAFLPPPPRVFPPAPPENIPAKTFALDEDFETYAPSQTMLNLASYEGDGGSARVVADTAAGGGQSLKIVDGGSDKQVFTPHLCTFKLRYEHGVVRECFAVRTETGAHVNVEWRDWPLPGDHYVAGPSLDILPDGALWASGRELMRLETGAWHRIEIECGIGERRTGTYRVSVVPGGEDKALVFDDIPLPADFHVVTWMGFSSYGAPGTTYYLDNLTLRCDGP